MVARVSFLPKNNDKKHLSFFQSSLERNKHLSFSRKGSYINYMNCRTVYIILSFYGLYINILQYDSTITICRIQPYAAVDVFFQIHHPSFQKMIPKKRALKVDFLRLDESLVEQGPGGLKIKVANRIETIPSIYRNNVNHSI